MVVLAVLDVVMPKLGGRSRFGTVAGEVPRLVGDFYERL